MTPERRLQIAGEVASLEKLLAKREAATKATKRAVEKLIADCEALFVVHESGERVLQWLEKYFCSDAKPERLLKMSAEDAAKFLARCQGQREVVQFLRAAARGALKVTDRAA